MPLLHDEFFLARLQKYNRIQVPVLIRWKHKLEPALFEEEIDFLMELFDLTDPEEVLSLMYKEAKERTSGELVLTNQRLLWFERRGMLSKTYRASFEIDLKDLKGITCGGVVKKWISITDKDGENVFHLYKVGKKEIEPFKDMILRQVEKLKQPIAQQALVTQKEVITKEIVMIPCDYCKALMPQTSTFCPQCGARRKG